MVYLLKILKSKWIYVILALLVGLGYIIHLNKSISTLNKELEIAKANVESYSNLYRGQLSDNSLLRLTEAELRLSNDSLLNELAKYIEENKKLKTPIIVGGVTQTIVDTLYLLAPVKLPEFNVTKVFNPETKVTVIGRDSTLSVIPDISNTIKLEIGAERVYKTQYKNWFIRLIHFDWKKVNRYRYSIDNSNKLIKLNDVKVVKIEDE